MIKKSIYNILLALGLTIFMCPVSQAIDVQDSLIVTDVTPAQFCVVWTASEPATGWIKVFEDPNGTTPYSEAVVEFQSAKHPPAENIGVMKVKVTGLKPDTEYFFQVETTAKVPKDNTIYPYPIVPPYIQVLTEKESIPVRNDVVAMKVSVGESKPAPGMLVVASIVDKASYPVGGWVGYGVSDDWVLIDTNNFYDKNTGRNFEVTGGEQIKLKLVGGLKGSVEIQDVLPDPEMTGGIQALKVAANLPDTGSGSTPDPGPEESSNPVSPDSGGGGGGGAGCFIGTASF